MQSDQPINTFPITSFIQNVKAADSSNAKEVKLTMQQAKGLAFTLGEVMSRLNGDLEQLLQKQYSGQNEVVNISVDGGNSW